MEVGCMGIRDYNGSYVGGVDGGNMYVCAQSVRRVEERSVVQAAAMVISLPFIDFHCTNAAPMIDMAAVATET